MTDERSHFKIAILWRGDREAREAATPQNNRYHRVFEELAALGVMAAPAVCALAERTYFAGLRKAGLRN